MSTASFDVGKSTVAPLPRTASADDPLRDEDLRRTRALTRIAAGFALACLVVVPFLGGDPTARRLFMVALAVDVIAAVWLAWSLREPSGYTTGRGLVFGYVCMLGGFACIHYFGVFSPAAAMIPVGLYFFGPTRSFRATLGIFLACALAELLLGGSVALGLLADRGLVRGDHLPLATRLVLLGLLETAYLAAYVLARSHRETTRRVLEDREQLQARMMVTDRLVSMGSLAAGVGHEINNPLTYAMANLKLASEELSRLRTGPSAKHAKSIDELPRGSLEGCERVRRTVRDLNALSRQEKESTQSAVDPREALDAAINVATSELSQRARVVRDYAEVPPVRGSESRLGQVFLNVLVNAAQALPEGQAERNFVRVSTRVGADGRVVVEITDTGPGIPQDVLARVFDPFFTTKAPGVGTGLGLSICHGIVTSLGGEIALESTVGRGTTVRVILPVSDAPLPVKAPRSLPAPPQGHTPSVAPDGSVRARVLIVDDEVAVARALERALKAHEVFTVASGAEALERCAREHFDLILCDLMMPDLTGMDVYERLKARAPEQAERMVFVTGGAFTQRAKEFVETVPNRKLSKPIDLKVLRELARERSERGLTQGSGGAKPPA